MFPADAEQIQEGARIALEEFRRRREAERAAAKIAPKTGLEGGDPIVSLPEGAPPSEAIAAEAAQAPVGGEGPLEGFIRPDAPPAPPAAPPPPPPSPRTAAFEALLAERNRPRPGEAGNPPGRNAMDSDANDPQLAAGPDDSPGALTATQRREVRAANEANGIPDPREQRLRGLMERIGDAKPDRGSQSLRRTQMAEGILRGLQGVMGIAGAGMQMGATPSMRRAGTALSSAAGAVPADVPGQIHDRRIAEAEANRAAAEDQHQAMTRQQQADAQTMAMETAARRTDLQSQAMEQEMAAQAAQAERLEQQRVGTAPEAQMLRDSIVANARALPDHLRGRIEPEIANIAERSYEDLQSLDQTIRGMLDDNPPRARRGGGGGRGGRARVVPDYEAPFNAREQGLIEEAGVPGTESRASAEQRIRDARATRDNDDYLRELDRMEQSQEAGAARLEPMRREAVEILSRQDILDEAAEAVQALSPDARAWIQRAASIQRAGGQGYLSEAVRMGAQGLNSAYAALGPEEAAAAEEARRRVSRVADLFARAESGAAINAQEWVRFYERIGGDITQSPEELVGAIQGLADEHRNRLNRWREAHPNYFRGTMVGGEPGEVGQVTVTYTRPDGATTTVIRNSPQDMHIRRTMVGSGVQWQDSNGESGDL